MKWVFLGILFWICFIAGIIAARGETIRNPAVVRAFQSKTLCPATGKPGRCPGYVVDHVIPLCAGGVDKPENMQYQDVAAGKQKDRLEKWICAFRRKGNGWACPAVKMGKQK